MQEGRREYSGLSVNTLVRMLVDFLTFFFTWEFLFLKFNLMWKSRRAWKARVWAKSQTA